MTIRLPAILFALLIFVLFLSFLYHPARVQSVSPNIVISEIQVAGTNGSDEFVELYNPTLGAVVMTDWKLKKKSSGGTETSLIASLNGTIPAHGYFLLAQTNYDGTPAPDAPRYASTMGDDNTILLYPATGTTPVDRVGMDNTATTETPNDPEGTAIGQPAANGSVERKPGESDALAGNGTDTDNNASDFVLRLVSEPQNASSPIEPAIEESPTPTQTPTQTPSTTPTEEPSQTPTQTMTPTMTPTLSPTQTLSLTPTATPTLLPSPTPTTQPNTNRFALRAFNNPLFFCTFTVESFDILGRTWFFPNYACILK